MVDFKYDFAFLIKMIKYVFLPVLAVVIVTAFIIYIYSRKVKKQDIKRYNYLVEFWTTFLAILIIGSLFAVTVGFAISLSDAIKMYNLVEGHEPIYYLVICSPLIPLLFLVIYIYRMIIVLLNKPKKQRELAKEEDIVPEPSAIVEEHKEDLNENEELVSPIVVSESDNLEQNELPKQEVIEVREFTPIVAPERYIDSKENEVNTEVSEQSVEEPESTIEEIPEIEDFMEEIEIL